MAYSNSDVAHNFAHQTGNKKNGSNIFYEVNENGSSTIYSYGKHFGIAHILEPSKYGLNVCLFTDASYSISTSGHISHVRGAVSHFDIIHVPQEVTTYIDYNGNLTVSSSQIEKDIKHYNSELNKLIKKHLRAIKYSYLDDILSLIENVRKYAELFNCKHRLKGKIRKAIYNDINTESEVLSTFFSDSEVQKIKDKRQAEKERKAKELKESIELFRNGKRAFVRGSNYTYLRLNEVGEDTKVQTSKSVNLMLSEAKHLWKLISIAKKQNKEIETQSRVSGFTIDKVTPNYIKAGCHTVTYSEAKRIAKKMNWVK